MPKQTYRKLDIAHEYLDVGARMYLSERYFPALALAGMAEEIFEAVMEARNVRRPGSSSPGLRFVPDVYEPIAKESIKLARIMNPALRKLPEGKIRWMLNRAKNTTKHGTLPDGRTLDLTAELDPELAAWWMLGRAVENYIRLHYIPEGAAKEFWLERYLPGRKTEHHKGASIGPHAKPYTIPTQKSVEDWPNG